MGFPYPSDPKASVFAICSRPTNKMLKNGRVTLQMSLVTVSWILVAPKTVLYLHVSSKKNSIVVVVPYCLESILKFHCLLGLDHHSTAH